MVQVQQQCNVYFCTIMIFISWFFWLIWHFKCLILMILTMTKYHENMLMVKFFSSLETKMIDTKNAKWNVFKNHPISFVYPLMRRKLRIGQKILIKITLKSWDFELRGALRSLSLLLNELSYRALPELKMKLFSSAN